jgi:hypothetical protein
MRPHIAYNRIAKDALMGLSTSPRGVKTYEVPFPVTFILPCDTTVLRRRMNIKLAVVESLMLIGGVFSLDAIKEVAPNANLELYKHQSDYGPRTRDQMQGILNLLIQDPDTRRAVVYFNTDRHFGSKDLACTTSIQWMIREDELAAYVTVRSWDLVYGTPMDIMMYGMLTQALALAVGVQPAMMHIIASCVHVYDKTKHLAQGMSGLHYELGHKWPKKVSNWIDVQRCALDTLARVLTDADDIKTHLTVHPIEEEEPDELHPPTHVN